MAAVTDILVIDDDPDIINYCTVVFEGRGYQVRGAVSAAEGEAALRERRPDLVILDIMMESPDSGFELANVIARDFTGLPVILFSSIADAAMWTFDTSALPVSAMLEKPIEPDDLLDTVRRLLKDKAPE
jgi:DNA-binding NtrC family response regulator